MSKHYIKQLIHNFLMGLLALAFILAAGITVGHSAELAIHCWNSKIAGEITTTELTVTITTSETAVAFLDSSGDEDTALPVHSTVTQNGCPSDLLIDAPAGWVFSAGSVLAAQWTISVEDLPGLTVTPPPDWNGAADFPVRLVYRNPPI